MRVKFSLAIEPFSINNHSYRDKRFKTADYKNYERRFFAKLAMKEPQEALAKVREYFDSSKHAFLVRLTFHRPAFFTAKGDISAQSMDLSNIEKLAVDMIFLPKYSTLPVPWGAPNVCADDKFIIALNSKKKFGPAERIDVSIAVVDRPKK